MSLALGERFWQKVDIKNHKECWLWLGAKSGFGYPQLYDGKRTRYAHVIALELTTGVSPERGYQVDHLCQNRSCVNPAHLEIVTQWENIKRQRSARRAA